jgi:hypothetical protein
VEARVSVRFPSTAGDPGPVSTPFHSSLAGLEPELPAA